MSCSSHSSTPSSSPLAPVVTGLLELLAPSRCLACRVRAAPVWCRRCESAVTRLAPGCSRCAGPRGPGHPCWPDPAPVAGTIAVFDYRGPVAAAVVSAKVAGARAGWGPLATLLAQRVATTPPPIDVVTWVTTPPARRRSRGFDHARLLAAEVAVALDAPLVATVEARAVREGHDRFRACRALPATDVLLVDDVLTTGRTAARVAAVLQRAGAGAVHLAVLARAGSHALVGPELTRVGRPSP